MNNVQFNIAVMFIAGTVAIGCTANDQTPADQTKGGVTITDTSKVSGTIVQMGDGRIIAIRNPGQAQVLVIEGRDVTPNSAPLGDARITGVATHNGQPVSDVYVSSHVLADDPLSSISASSTKTNKKGRFELRDLPSARISIRFYKMPPPGSGGKRWSKIDTVDLTNKNARI